MYNCALAKTDCPLWRRLPPENHFHENKLETLAIGSCRGNDRPSCLDFQLCGPWRRKAVEMAASSVERAECITERMLAAEDNLAENEEGI